MAMGVSVVNTLDLLMSLLYLLDVFVLYIYM